MEEKVFVIELTDQREFFVKGTKMRSENGGVEIINETTSENEDEEDVVLKVPEPTLMNAYLKDKIVDNSSDEVFAESGQELSL